MSDKPSELTPEEIDEIIAHQNKENLAKHYETLDLDREYYDELPGQLVVDPNNPDRLKKYDKKGGRIEIEEIDVCKETEISRLADRRILDTKERFMVDEVLPTGQIHILSGPSGVGKTRWLQPFIKDWYEGKNVVGYKSNPEPYLYISCDRSAKSLNQTLRKLGLENWDLHFKTISDIQEDLNITDYEKLKLEDIIKYYVNIKVFFIEAIGWFQQMGNKVNQYAENLRYWVNVQKLVEKYDVTIIGTTHSPKSKPNDRHDNPRERVIGSVAMGAIVDTIFLLEFDDVKDVTNKNRVLRIMPRNVESSILHYSMGKGGILELLSEEEAKELEVRRKQDVKQEIASNTRKAIIMDSYLLWKDIPNPITMPDIVKYALANEVSEATAYRWKDTKLLTKELVEVKRGVFQKGRPN